MTHTFFYVESFNQPIAIFIRSFREFLHRELAASSLLVAQNQLTLTDVIISVALQDPSNRKNWLSIIIVLNSHGIPLHLSIVKHFFSITIIRIMVTPLNWFKILSRRLMLFDNIII